MIQKKSNNKNKHTLISTVQGVFLTTGAQEENGNTCF